VPGSALPRVTRLFLAGNAVAMTGNVLVIAFTLIYLHQARGIALPVVGLLLAAGAAAGLLAVTVSGVLLDRLGARRVLTGIILGQATAQVLLAWAHNAAAALPALLLYSATWAPMFPAIATVDRRADPRSSRPVARVRHQLHRAERRDRDRHGTRSRRRERASSRVFPGPVPGQRRIVPDLRRGADLPARSAHRARKERAASRLRDVLARPGLRLVLVASLIVAFTAYPAFDSGLPAYASVEAHVSARVVALSLTVNTALIVLAQLFVLRGVRRARRSSALAISGPILAASWAVFGPRRAAGRGHRANCFRVRLHCAVRARRDRAGTHCEPACQSPDRRQAPRAGQLARRPLPVPGVHHLPRTGNRLHRRRCSRGLDWPAVCRLPRHRRRRSPASPRADLRPGPCDRSARDPA
jgi:hypothetical protein